MHPCIHLVQSLTSCFSLKTLTLTLTSDTRALPPPPPSARRLPCRSPFLFHTIFFVPLCFLPPGCKRTAPALP